MWRKLSGEHIEGTGLATLLVGVEFVHGETVEDRRERQRLPGAGHAGLGRRPARDEIRKLAIGISCV